MSPERLKEIFAHAESLSARQRAVYLDTELADEPGARAHIERLLAASDDLDEGAFSPLVDSPESLASEPDAPERIGRYRVLSLLGRGGMAYVYRAVQEQPIRREVALKVIRPGFDTQAVLSRFDSERQALARLEHRNIATVLDAGADPYGPSWFSMSLVDGPPITDFCEERQLDFRARLKLFVQVCRGVQHAHLRGILHRDLKPSNILVCEEDGDAVPKIIDFGVAKALGADESLGDSKQTLATQIVGTLEYMSPEQARFGNPDVDARSDVYALGVVLYELLTGRVPIGGDEFKGISLDRIQAKIESKQADKPSGISLVGADPEFDCVVMKALEKLSNDRYDTPRDLADDIERYLDGRPLAVRPPTRLYIFSRFASRNKPLVGGITVAVVLLLAGLVGTSIGLYREHQVSVELADTNRELKAKADALSIALNDAEELGEMTRDVFFGIQPEREGRDVTLREAIVDAATKQTKESTASSYASASLARSLMDPLWTLGEYELSEAMATRVIEWAGPGLEGTEPIMAAGALWRRAHARSRLGKGDAAKDDFVRSITLADELGAEASRFQYRSRLGLGEWYDTRADYTEGLALKREALRILEESDPANINERAVVYGQIGRTYSQLGNSQQALEYAERGLRLRESIATPNDLQVLTLQRNVALVAMDAGDYERAAVILEPHVPAITEALGPESTAALYSATLLGSCRARIRDKPAEDVLNELRRVVNTAERVTAPRLSYFLRAYEVNAMLAYGMLDEALAAGNKLILDGEAAFGAESDQQMQLRMMLVMELVEYEYWELAISPLKMLLNDLRATRSEDDALVTRVRTALEESEEAMNRG